MSCRCRRGSHFMVNGSVLVLLDGLRLIEQFELVPMPERLLETMQDLFSRVPQQLMSKMSCLQVFLVKKSSRGSFYSRPDLIVLDEAQIRGFATTLAQEKAARLVVEDHARRHGRWTTDTDAKLLYYSLLGRVLAHEVGHALRSRGVGTPFEDEEKAADYLAGILDAKRHKSRVLGEKFFFSIGCNHPGCDHPTSEARRAAYNQGYDDQLAAEQERERERQQAERRAQMQQHRYMLEAQRQQAHALQVALAVVLLTNGLR